MTDDLDRAARLLDGGDLDAARDFLERLHAAAPDDARAAGLLALALFRAGDHARAAALYGALAAASPDDATLRVNLGLALLKAGRPAEAAGELRAAVGLAPDHRRAHGYLGLALARLGDRAAAREAFLRAGEEAMARRMEDPGAGAPPAEAAGALLARVAERGLGRLEDEEQPFGPVEEGAATEEGWLAAEPAEAGTPAAATILPAPVPVPPSFAGLAAAVRLPEPPAGPFAAGDFGAALDVRGAILARLDGVFAACGSLRYAAAEKRFRGRATGAGFGEGPRQVFRVEGTGRLLVAPRDPAGAPRRLLALRLADEDAYFTEPALFAFEEGLAFENGRVPGPPADLPLVHLRGTGHVLLASSAPVRALRVEAAAPLRIPSRRLAGWSGSLTPRLLPLEGAPEEGLGVGVELAGEGEVLLVP